MPRDHNRVCMTGRLARDPELKRSQSGKSVLSFTLAVDNSYKDKAGGTCSGRVLASLCCMGRARRQNREVLPQGRPDTYRGQAFHAGAYG